MSNLAVIYSNGTQPGWGRVLPGSNAMAKLPVPAPQADGGRRTKWESHQRCCVAGVLRCPYSFRRSELVSACRGSADPEDALQVSFRFISFHLAPRLLAVPRTQPSSLVARRNVSSSRRVPCVLHPSGRPWQPIQPGRRDLCQPQGGVEMREGTGDTRRIASGVDGILADG